MSINIEIRRAFFNNYAAYYEKVGNYSMASIMTDKAITIDIESHDDISSAIDYNNKSVMLLKLSKWNEARKSLKQALLLLEPIVHL